MSIRKRGRSHQVRLPGERARSFPSKRQAERYQDRRKGERAAGEHGAALPITLAEALDGCIKRWATATRPAPSSVEAAKSRAAFWTKAGLGARRLDLLGLVEVEDVIVARAEEARAAAKVELEWLKRALKDAHRRRQRFDPALLTIPPIRRESREGIALDLPELQLLASCFPEEIVYLPEIVGSLGLRIGEALSLPDEHIDLNHGSVYVPARLNKEGRDKVIELAGHERTLIAQQLMARPQGARVLFPRVGYRRPVGVWEPHDFRERVWRPAREEASRTLREKQDLPPSEPTRFDLLVPHDLRHTAISAMAAGGMRPEVIARRVGHADGGRLILERYRHLFPDEMATQLEGFSRWRETRAVGK